MIVKSIVWQLEAWEMINGELKLHFNGRMTSPVRENGVEYCANNGANSVITIQKVSHSGSNNHSCYYQWP